ncbi:MAG: 4Fe-4S binding protein [Bacteroidales bacterium]|jgi:NADH-quinone oxidoreductase subunit I|nr:4Fe-4S binding protein [Bacteroidales bacterium]
MKSVIEYFRGIFNGIKSLLVGMTVTGGYFFRPGTTLTQQYPDNRDTLVMFERFKGEVVMPHNEKNEHKCTGCGICEINCPNGSIEVIPATEVTEEGKKKRIIDKHIYHLGMCTFCGLCVKTCPSQALAFSQEFEHAVFDRTKLTKVLNQPGSKLMKGVE